MNNQEMLNAKGKGKAFFKKAGQKLKTASLAPSRAGYLAVLRLNLFGSASHLNDLKTKDAKKYGEARDRWYKFGGNRTEFDKVIAKGAKKKAVRFKFSKKKGADGMEYYGICGFDSQESLNFSANMPWLGADGVWNNADSSWMDIVGAASVASAVSAAVPVITAINSVAGKPKEMDESSAKTITEESQSKSVEIQKGLTEQAEIAKASGGAEPDPEGKDALGANTMGMPTWAWIAIGGGVLAVGGVIAWVVLKNKK